MVTVPARASSTPTALLEVPEEPVLFQPMLTVAKLAGVPTFSVELPASVRLPSAMPLPMLDDLRPMESSSAIQAVKVGLLTVKSRSVVEVALVVSF